MSHTPNLSDRVAWGAGSFSAGTYLEAGLPNITGRFDVNTNDGYVKTVVFYISAANSLGGADGEQGPGGYINFDASRSNPIYGRSTTVRPPSLVVQFYIRAK